MIKKALLIASLFMFWIASSQLDPNTLLRLPIANDTDINLTTPASGSVVYSLDTNQMYIYTGSGYETISSGPQVYVGSFQISATGNLDITGLPFQPSSIIFTAYANIETTDINDDNDAIPDADNDNTLANSFGSMKGYARDDGATISEQVICNGGNGNSINDISRYASSSHCIGVRYGNQNGDQVGLTTATLSSFNADGFTINTDNFSDGLLVIFEAHR